MGWAYTSFMGELVANPDVSLGLFYRSDHFNFAKKGVPMRSRGVSALIESQSPKPGQPSYSGARRI